MAARARLRHLEAKPNTPRPFRARASGSTSLCKPESCLAPGSPDEAEAIIPLGRRSPDGSSSLPAGSGEQPSPATRTEVSAADRLPMWPCSRWGLPCRPRYRGRGGLLPRRFTLTARRERGAAVCSLWHSPRRFRHRSLSGIVLCGARTFLPPREAAGDRPSGVDGRQCAPWGQRAQPEVPPQAGRQPEGRTPTRSRRRRADCPKGAPQRGPAAGGPTARRARATPSRAAGSAWRDRAVTPWRRPSARRPSPRRTG